MPLLRRSWNLWKGTAAARRRCQFHWNKPDKGITEVCTIKNKGPLGTVPIAFIDRYPKFGDLDQETLMAWRARHWGGR